MTTEFYFSRLKNFPLFTGVDDTVLKNIAASLDRPVTYRIGDTVMASTHQKNDVFLILQGRARLLLPSVQGNIISYRDIECFDYFGWLSALDRQERLTDAIALEDCEIWTISAEQFHNILFMHPRIHENFMARVASVIRYYTNRIHALTTLTARDRIIHDLIRRINLKTSQIDITSHADLATWTATSRETVTRTLLALEREGYILKDKHGYHLLKPLEASDNLPNF
jgi:CRP/FNR family cyclic AMP-dependent transcriptional regulator